MVVELDPELARSLIADSDRTIRTLLINLDRARRTRRPLAQLDWLPSQGESWTARFREAQGRYPGVDEVFRSLHTDSRERRGFSAALCSRLEYSIGGTVATAVEGLVDLGLLGLRHQVLDALSDEQLIDSLKDAGRDLPDVTAYWDVIIDCIAEILTRTRRMVGRLSDTFANAQKC